VEFKLVARSGLEMKIKSSRLTLKVKTDGAIPRNARMNLVFLNHFNHFDEWVLMELFDGPLHPQI
jgi:hypothetical protein